MNKDLLPKELQDVLTEESVSVIETALKEKVELSVEAALTSQDELYAEKLEELVTRIDSDHTSKMQTVVEAVDKNNANKLVKNMKLKLTKVHLILKSILLSLFLVILKNISTKQCR